MARLQCPARGDSDLGRHRFLRWQRSSESLCADRDRTGAESGPGGLLHLRKRRGPPEPQPLERDHRPELSGGIIGRDRRGVLQPRLPDAHFANSVPGRDRPPLEFAIPAELCSQGGKQAWDAAHSPAHRIAKRGPGGAGTGIRPVGDQRGNRLVEEPPRIRAVAAAIRAAATTAAATTAAATTAAATTAAATTAAATTAAATTAAGS